MMAAHIGVGIGKDELSRDFVERRKKCVGFLGGFAQERHGVICHEDGWLVEVETEPILHLIAREQRTVAKMIERGGAGAMDSPWLLSHCNDAVSRVVGRGEMDVAHFGEGISYGIVDGAFADFASFDMRDGNAKSE